MSKELKNALLDLGLNAREAKVYLLLLELGEATASTIAKKGKIERSSVYVTLKALQKKGFLSSYNRRKVQHFAPLDPKRAISSVQDKIKRAEDLLPEFSALYSGSEDKKPKILFFEGIDGLIHVMEDTLVIPNKTIYAWADIDLAWHSLRHYYPEYIRKKNENNITVQGIFVDNTMGRLFKERSQEEMRSAYLVSEEKFPMKNEINIYDDKIYIISHEDQFGVIIQNDDVAETQRSIFRLCWSLLSKEK